MLLLYIVSFKEFGSLVCLWHDVKLRKTQLEVRSLIATWSRDLWGHRVVVFLEMCQIVGWTAMANLAALRAAVFSLSAKNLRGGWNQPPPAGARVKAFTALKDRFSSCSYKKQQPISLFAPPTLPKKLHLMYQRTSNFNCSLWKMTQHSTNFPAQKLFWIFFGHTSYSEVCVSFWPAEGTWD